MPGQCSAGWTACCETPRARGALTHDTMREDASCSRRLQSHRSLYRCATKSAHVRSRPGRSSSRCCCAVSCRLGGMLGKCAPLRRATRPGALGRRPTVRRNTCATFRNAAANPHPAISPGTKGQVLPVASMRVTASAGAMIGMPWKLESESKSLSPDTMSTRIRILGSGLETVQRRI